VPLSTGDLPFCHSGPYYILLPFCCYDTIYACVTTSLHICYNICHRLCLLPVFYRPCSYRYHHGVTDHILNFTLTDTTLPHLPSHLFIHLLLFDTISRWVIYLFTIDTICSFVAPPPLSLPDAWSIVRCHSTYGPIRYYLMFFCYRYTTCYYRPTCVQFTGYSIRPHLFCAHFIGPDLDFCGSVRVT